MWITGVCLCDMFRKNSWVYFIQKNAIQVKKQKLYWIRNFHKINNPLMAKHCTGFRERVLFYKWHACQRQGGRAEGDGMWNLLNENFRTVSNLLNNFSHNFFLLKNNNHLYWREEIICQSHTWTILKYKIILYSMQFIELNFYKYFFSIKENHQIFVHKNDNINSFNAWYCNFLCLILLYHHIN